VSQIGLAVSSMIKLPDEIDMILKREAAQQKSNGG
jgi:hypothetical protein